MTKVGQIFEEERLEYGKEKEQAAMKKVVEKMLRKGEDMVDIMEITEFTREQIETIKEELFSVSK